MNELKLNHVYKHFKGKLYMVTDVAKDAETGDEVVIYRQLYGSRDLWVRKKDAFLSEVDREKYPDAGQKYRFELVGLDKFQK